MDGLSILDNCTNLSRLSLFKCYEVVLRIRQEVRMKAIYKVLDKYIVSVLVLSLIMKILCPGLSLS